MCRLFPQSIFPIPLLFYACVCGCVGQTEMTVAKGGLSYQWSRKYSVR